MPFPTEQPGQTTSPCFRLQGYRLHRRHTGKRKKKQKQTLKFRTVIRILHERTQSRSRGSGPFSPCGPPRTRRGPRPQQHKASGSPWGPQGSWGRGLRCTSAAPHRCRPDPTGGRRKREEKRGGSAAGTNEWGAPSRVPCGSGQPPPGAVYIADPPRGDSPSPPPAPYRSHREQPSCCNATRVGKGQRKGRGGGGKNEKKKKRNGERKALGRPAGAVRAHLRRGKGLHGRSPPCLGPAAAPRPLNFAAAGAGAAPPPAAAANNGPYVY